jgi:hypothetical protein
MLLWEIRSSKRKRGGIKEGRERDLEKKKEEAFREENIAEGKGKWELLEKHVLVGSPLDECRWTGYSSSGASPVEGLGGKRNGRKLRWDGLIIRRPAISVLSEPSPRRTGDLSTRFLVWIHVGHY